MFLQLDGKLMEKIAITTQSLKMLNTQKSRDPNIKIPREVLALSYCIIHMTCFSSGMVFMLSVCSQSSSATLLWEFHFMNSSLHSTTILPQHLFFSTDRSNAYVIYVLNTRSRNMNARSNQSFHTSNSRYCMLVGKKKKVFI